MHESWVGVGDIKSPMIITIFNFIGTLWRSASKLQSRMEDPNQGFDTWVSPIGVAGKPAGSSNTPERNIDHLTRRQMGINASIVSGATLITLAILLVNMMSIVVGVLSIILH